MSLFSTYVSSTCFGPHRSIIRRVLQAVFADLVCANMCVLLDTSSRYKVTKFSLIYLWPDECCPVLAITENKHPELEHRITATVKLVTRDVMENVWKRMKYRIDICYMAYSLERMGQISYK